MHDPTLRPANLTRSLFHMTGGLFALATIELLGTRPALVAVSGVIMVSAWAAETARRLSPTVNEGLMWVFGPVAHGHEREEVNSATWYATALFLLALFMPVAACAVAVVVLGFGDPMAAIIGRRWGHTRLWSGRSLEGSFAFVVTGTIAAFAALRAFHPEVAVAEAALLALVGAFAGAVAELTARRVDDNFAIPVVAAVGAAVVMALI